MAGTGISGSLSGGKSSNKSVSKVSMPKWFREPLSNYLANLKRLQGPSPYAGADLGYGPETMSIIAGGARDMSAGAFEGARQGITDTYAAPGGPGVGSYAHKMALSGLANTQAAGVAQAGTQLAESDAMLRRQDAMSRLQQGLSTGSLARSFATERNRGKGRTFGWDVSASYGA